jgi:DegV family protein with EDD domain
VIGLITDSNAQLPAELALELAVEVIPLTVLIDGRTHLEGVDLKHDDFYDALADGADVSTSQPSPGEFAEYYGRLERAGVTDIVSIHVGGELSGTLNSARLASEMVTAKVHLVDSAQTSFGLGWCVLAAADARDAGCDVDAMVTAALGRGRQIRNVFVMGGLELARAGGRMELDEIHELAFDNGDEVPVMAFADGALDVLGTASGVRAATMMMVDAILESPGPVHVAVGVADAQTERFRGEFVRLLEGHDRVTELVHYRCGPSVGAHTGAGTAGACWFHDSDR